MFNRWAAGVVIALAAFFLNEQASAEMLRAGQFTIEYNVRDVAAATESASILEEAAGEFGERLPIGDAPVRIVIASSYEAFRQFAPRLAQHNVSGIARAEEGLIVLKPPRLREPGGDFRGTLRHELVHVLLHRNVDTALLPRWLNEGLCMSMANEYRWASTLEVARMFSSGQIIPMRALDLAFYTPGNETEFGNAYAQALSMTRRLRNQLGEEAFWRLIGSMKTNHFSTSLESVAGMTVEEFWHGYTRSLWWVALVGMVTTGSIFGPAALLLILGAWRKQRQNRRTLDQWAIEEAEDTEEVFDWDKILDDADYWKRGTEYDSDPDR